MAQDEVVLATSALYYDPLFVFRWSIAGCFRKIDAPFLAAEAVRLQRELPVGVTEVLVGFQTHASKVQPHFLAACGSERELVNLHKVAFAFAAYVVSDENVPACMTEYFAILVAGTLQVVSVFLVAELVKPLALRGGPLDALQRMYWETEGISHRLRDMEVTKIIWMARIIKQVVWVGQSTTAESIEQVDHFVGRYGATGCNLRDLLRIMLIDY